MRSRYFRCAAILAGMVFPISALATVVPVDLVGFNQDVIVDVNAPENADVRSFITATMDSGTAKTGATFFEYGYVDLMPFLGLRPGGITRGVTMATLGASLIQPANANNVLLLNDTTPTGTLTFLAPVSALGLDFTATSAGAGGLSTLQLTIHFVGGATETSSTTSKDWMLNPGVSVNDALPGPNGRISDVATGATDSLALNGFLPKIYFTQIDLANRTTPIQSVEFTRVSGPGNTAIFGIGTTPEPSSLMLAAAGGFALLARRRRRTA